MNNWMSGHQVCDFAGWNERQHGSLSKQLKVMRDAGVRTKRNTRVYYYWEPDVRRYFRQELHTEEER
jgi:hypothetical protein